MWRVGYFSSHLLLKPYLTAWHQILTRPIWFCRSLTHTHHARLTVFSCSTCSLYQTTTLKKKVIWGKHVSSSWPGTCKHHIRSLTLYKFSIQDAGRDGGAIPAATFSYKYPMGTTSTAPARVSWVCDHVIARPHVCSAYVWIQITSVFCHCFLFMSPRAFLRELAA